MQTAPAIDLSAIPAAQRAAVLALMETVAAPGHAGVPAAQAVESTVNRGVSISNDVPPQLEKNDVRSRDASLRSRDRDGR